MGRGKWRLTGDMRGGIEYGLELRVDCDIEVSLNCLLGISCLDLLQDPIPERVADDAVCDVTDPLLRQLGQLLLDGQVASEFLVGAPLGQDGLEVQALILRDGEVAEGAGADETEKGLELGAGTYRLIPFAMSFRK
jgi:hypothetical protein